jgi:hypothetical protein
MAERGWRRLWSHDEASMTPAAKSVPVRIRTDGDGATAAS